MYFCKYGGEVLRACIVGDAPIRNRDKDSSNWGSKLKLDISKPILGLTCHPSDPSLVMLLHADGGLRCYQVWTVRMDMGGMRCHQVWTQNDLSEYTRCCLCQAEGEGRGGRRSMRCNNNNPLR